MFGISFKRATNTCICAIHGSNLWTYYTHKYNEKKKTKFILA